MNIHIKNNLSNSFFMYAVNTATTVTAISSTFVLWILLLYLGFPVQFCLEANSCMCSVITFYSAEVFGTQCLDSY